MKYQSSGGSRKRGGIQLAIMDSGSKGNCALLVCGGFKALIDAGLSCRRTLLWLNRWGVAPEDLDAIFLTHEHTDHVRGLPMLLRLITPTVYCNKQTADCLRVVPSRLHLFKTGGTVKLGDLMVETVPVPHDASEPVAFIFIRGKTRLGFFTDFGHVTRLVVEKIQSCTAVVLEANHDPQMEVEANRPEWVKQRTLGPSGHLSNEAAAKLLVKIVHPGLQSILLCHLSQDCNRPNLAVATVKSMLAETKHTKLCVRVAEPGRWLLT